MVEYRLLNYAGVHGEARPGVSVGDRVADLQDAVEKRGAVDFSAASTLSVLDRWDASEPVLEAIARELAGDTLPSKALSEIRLMAPLLYPGAIFNAASNYSDHRAEMGGKGDFDKSAKSPYIFLKSPAHCTIGSGEQIRIPHTTQQLDWEAELGVVIGRRGRNLSKATARSVVAGYTICNDLSARDNSPRADWPNFRSDWFTHKSFETSAPTGPWIVPAKQIPDPYACKIDLWVNDEHMQDANAGMMIFNIEEQIEFISARMTLRPGDLLATGTPSGVGRPRGIFLKPGDTVKITISGIGTLLNTVVQGE